MRWAAERIVNTWATMNTETLVNHSNFPRALMCVFAAVLVVVSGVPDSACAGPLDTLPAGQWYELPGFKLSAAAVGPCPARGCSYSGSDGRGGITPLGCGTYDSDRNQLILWGGGHGNYGGTEVYAFDLLTAATPTWRRLTDPTNPAVINTNCARDGRPTSRHTQDSIVYMSGYGRRPCHNKMMNCEAAGFYPNGYTETLGDVFYFTSNRFLGEPWSRAAHSPQTAQPVNFFKLASGSGSPDITNFFAATNPVPSGTAPVLNWVSNNFTGACVASGAWSGSKTTSGTESLLAITATANYTITCGSAVRTLTVSVSNGTPIPTVALAASPASITSGAAATLTWVATSATSCAASGAWSGARSTADAFIVTPIATSTDTLTCTGAGGSSAHSVTVTVVNAAPPPTTVNIGETTVLATNDSGNGGLLLAQQASLATTATIQSLSFYVTTPGGDLRLGIYDATGPGGGPGAKRAETNSFTPISGWNTANVIAPVSLPAGVYWLAYFPSSSALGFRVDTTGSAKWYSYPFGVMPNTFSTSPTSGAYHWSFYATLSAVAAPPDTTLPSVPTNLMAGAVSASQINLSWSGEM